MPPSPQDQVLLTLPAKMVINEMTLPANELMREILLCERLYLNSFDGGIEVLNVGAKPNLNSQPWVYLLKLGDRAIWTKWRPLWFEFLL